MIEALRALSRLLPRVAEEGNDHEVRSEPELALLLAGEDGDKTASSVVVSCIRQFLLATSCLDDRDAAGGRWRFTSYPAYLFARSILEGLIDGDLRLLDRGFWEPSLASAQRQHDLLHKLEVRRQAASDSPPQPIRRVWVAWALMSVDGRFLLVRREDANPDRLDSLGSFVLPGGRVSPGDLPVTDVGARLDFFDPRCALPESTILPVLERTLRRELLEELGLESGDIARSTPMGGQLSYRALEGANAAHAHTEYFLQTFRVEPTRQGKHGLLRSLATYPEKFDWFSREEFLAKRNGRGNTAFVDALLQAPEAECDALLTASETEISLGDATTGTKQIEVPVGEADLLVVGDASRERPLSLPVDPARRQVLAFLAAVRRGDAVEALATGIRIVPGTGWVWADSDDAYEALRSLAKQLTRLDKEWTPVAVEDRAFRLNVARPELVFLSPGAFSLAVAFQGSDERFRMRLARDRFECALGVVPSRTDEIVVSNQLGGAILDLLEGRASAKTHEKWSSIQRQQRDELGAFFVSTGLRLLLRQQGGVPALTVRRRLDSDADKR